MDIRITGTANLQQMRSQFAAMQKEVAALNEELAATTIIPGRVNPAGYQNYTRQVAKSSQVWRDAAASTGLFTTQQLKLNSATEQYTELLKRQKLSLTDLRKNRAVLKRAYEEQIAMQQMVVRENPVLGAGGKGAYDIAVPKTVSKELDTIGNRLGWVSAQTASASRQMINWGKNTQWAGRQLMVGFTMPVAAFGAATGVLAYNVDKQLTRIQKVYDTTAQVVAGDAESMKKVNAELAQVSEAAMNTAANAAQQYGASYSDTLGVQAELAATGVKGAKLQKATTEAMRLATLGELDYNQAASTTIALQTAFRLNTQQLTEAFNFMNATENATSLSIQDIAEATPRAASAMSALGVTVQQMTVMLASMKESGVDAAEAANALKSATGTMLSPSPSAQKFIDQITHGRIQIAEIAKEADGNLYVALQHLSQEMDGLSKFEKQQILVKLFGKYQFNRVSAMLYNMEDAFNGVQNQTHKAMELMGKDSQYLADTADQEMKRYQESISGTFKRTLETLKGELSEVGKPFLQVATIVMQVLAKLAEKFNALPDGLKTFLAIGSILTALVGPTIMMIGLAANFAGNLGLVVARILSLGSNLEILNKSEWATKKIAESTTSSIDRQTTAVEALTQQINILVQSAAEARQAVQAMSETRITPLGMPTMGANGPAVKAHEVTKGAPAFIPLGSIGGRVDNTPTRFAQGARKSDLAKQAELAQRRATAERNALNSELASTMAVRDQNAANDALLAKKASIAKVSGKVEENINGARVATAGMAASTALMVQPWSHIGANVGQLLLIGTLVIPAIKTLSLMATGFAAKMAKAYTAARGVAAAEAVAMGATTKMAGSAALFRAGLAGAGRALFAMLGPIGIVTAGLAAAGFVAYKMWKNNEEHIKRIKAEQDALNNSVDTWSETLGVVAKQYKQLTIPNASDIGKMPIDEVVSRFKQQPGAQTMIDAYNNAPGDTKNTIALQQYVKLLQETNANAKKAKIGLQAFFMAAGDAAMEADVKAQQFYDTIGSKVSKNDMSQLWTAQFNDLANFGGDGDWITTANERGTEIGKTLADAIARQKAPSDKMAVLEQFKKAAASTSNGFWEQFSKGPATGRFGEMTFAGFFKQLDITSKKQFDQFAADLQAYGDRTLSPEAFQQHWAGLDLQNSDMARVISNMQGMNYADNQANTEAQRAAVQVLKEQLGIKEDISTIDQLQSTYEWQLYTVTKKTAPEVLKLAEARALEANAAAVANGATSQSAGAMNLLALNTVRVAMGLKPVDNLIWGFRDTTYKAAQDTKEIADNLNSMPNYLSIQVNFDNEDWKNMYQQGMSGVMGNMADQASSRFDDMMNAAVDGAQQKGDKAMARLQNKQQNDMDAFDARWDKHKKAVEAAYDARAKGIDKEIKAEEDADKIRQKIFQNEMDRMSRLNEAANRNIDFNVALNSGNFDEAAKIRNDMQNAANQNALQDALDAQSGKSEKRIDRLNKKKDNIEEQKQRVLDALQKQEDAERKHLEKVQKMREDALKAQTDSEVEAMKARWEKDKETLDSRLELFKSYTARNQKDLERWMKVVGLTYDDFGIDVKNKGDAWSTYFRDSLASNIHEAGAKIMSDNMWEKMGGNIAKDLLGGALDMSPSQFKHWMLTGEFKTGGYKSPSQRDASKNDVATGGGRYHDPTPVIRHTGGEINSSMGSRKGVARTAGMHSSERMVLAQDGEFMVNRKAAKEHGPLLHAMNSGKLDASRRNIGRGTGGGSPLGIAGAMAGIIAAAMKAGVSRGMNDQIARKQNEQAALTLGPSSGLFSAGKPGMYSDRSFGPEQLKNAATIASVGSSMGMSSRDIMIGIMTAITESGLINVNYGDRDSLGLFQQRPSAGWGTPDQVTDPEYAARKFFSVLKGVSSRGSMAPWLAAQAVQRSAFSDGSNYRQYWDNAEAIFNKGLSKSGNGYTVTAPPGTGGTGGWHKPSVPGKGWVNSHDYRNGPGSPLYAYNDGVVVKSEAITSGGSPGNGVFTAPNGKPYRSYGEYILLRGNDGAQVSYAHLSPGKRYVSAGQRVKGGQLIGLSGWTGNATGPHTHFDVNGSYMAKEWFASHGIGLKTGGFINRQGISNLHNDEVVVDAARTAKLWKSMDAFNFAMGNIAKSLPNANVGIDRRAVTNVANGGENHYNAEVNLYGSDLNVDDVTKAVFKAFKKMDDRKPGSRRE